MDTEKKVLQVPIEDIIPNRFQPRLAFDDAALQELAESIKVHGIIQPLVLRRMEDKYEIVAGERRYRAAKIAGLTSVPAILTVLNDNESAEVAIVENVQRKDLTSIEEARSYKVLLDQGTMSQEELANKMGLSQSAISNKLRLLNLAIEVQDAIINEKISERHARSLLKLKTHDDQRKLLNKTITERLTVKQLEEEIKKINDMEVPLIKNIINLNEIKEKSTDIKITNEEKVPEIKPIMENKYPNKFFNFLEDESANMNIEEIENTFDLEKNTNNIEENNEIEEIEMLDDFNLETKNEDNTLNEITEFLKKYQNVEFDINKTESLTTLTVKITENN